MTQSDTFQVSGIRCDNGRRLVGRAHRARGSRGANANLMGLVTLEWDDARTSREALLEAMAKAGFRELPVGV